MKLIIDISEDVYKRTKFHKEFRDLNDCVITIKSLENGTPLEKHDEEIIRETIASIWGKPPYNEVLDKIKAEILDFKEKCTACDYLGCGILDLIDKYRK